jgi:antitoxin component of RelBE/YafQ-DinJ toxin-antitoxin module
MALSERHLKAAEEARAELDTRTPEENRRTAQLIRELAEGLDSKAHRARSEEIARSFEARADGAQKSGSSPAA